MNNRISLNMLCQDLKPSQSDINLLKQFGILDATKYAGQIFCSNIPNSPIKAAVPIFQMYHAVNLRNDKLFSCYFANSWRLINTLRHLKSVLPESRNKFYLYVDCPAWLYPSERPNFVAICNTYKCEFTIITSSATYQDMLRELGCIVHDKTVLDYNVNELVYLIEEDMNGK